MRPLWSAVLVAVLLPSLCLARGDGEGEGGAASSASAPLLQPADFTTKSAPFDSPEKAAKLVKEMTQQWEGMESPLNTPWSTVYTQGHDPSSRSPSALVGTPEDPFTPQFGPWRQPPRAIPPTRAYRTFVFNPEDIFQRDFKKPKVGIDGRPLKQRNPANKDYWHPYLNVQPLESTDFPSVVVPVPRPIYGRRAKYNGMHRTDYTYEHIPPRARIIKPLDLPLKKEHLVPTDLKYPEYNLLNPRSAFTRHHRGTNIQSFGRDSLLEVGSAVAAPHKSRLSALLELQEFRRSRGKPKDASKNEGMPKAPTPAGTVLGYDFLPLGRKGPIKLYTPPQERKTQHKVEDYDEIRQRYGEPSHRGQSLLARLLGDPEGPYRHGYNHQVHGIVQQPPVSRILKGEPSDGAEDAAEGAPDTPPNALVHNSADNKAVAEPALPDPLKEREWGAQGVAEEAGEEGLSPEIQPESHGFNLPVKREQPSREEFQSKFPDAKKRYAEHYPAPKLGAKPTAVKGKDSLVEESASVRSTRRARGMASSKILLEHKPATPVLEHESATPTVAAAKPAVGRVHVGLRSADPVHHDSSLIQYQLALNPHSQSVRPPLPSNAAAPSSPAPGLIETSAAVDGAAPARPPRPPGSVDKQDEPTAMRPAAPVARAPVLLERTAATEKHESTPWWLRPAEVAENAGRFNPNAEPAAVSADAAMVSTAPVPNMFEKAAPGLASMLPKAAAALPDIAAPSLIQTASAVQDTAQAAIPTSVNPAALFQIPPPPSVAATAASQLGPLLTLSASGSAYGPPQENEAPAPALVQEQAAIQAPVAAPAAPAAPAPQAQAQAPAPFAAVPGMQSPVLLQTGAGQSAPAVIIIAAPQQQASPQPQVQAVALPPIVLA